MTKLPVFEFSEQLLNSKGIVTLPNKVYNFAGNHLRIGFGRANTPQALQELRAFMEEV